jgi:acetyl esterase
MNKFLSTLVITFVLHAAVSPVNNLAAQTPASSSNSKPVEKFTVTSVAAENGSYTISPKISKDGKVPAGTVLTVKAKPAAAHRLDAVYYTVKGGIWGTTSFESFSPEMKITVTKDMKIGATFIPRSLVDNVRVTQDVVYMQSLALSR